LKLASKNINEKFTSNSYPIEDMNIGIIGLLNIFIKELKQGKYNFFDWYEHFNNDDDLLWICARYNKIELVKYLLNKGANIHYKSNRALRWAVYNKNYEITHILLEMGADVNAYDSGAYELAKSNNDSGMLSLLKKYGATPPTGNRPALEEKFEQDSDPLQDLGIGLIYQIEK
jgi:ankyrin repeat protein